MDLVRQHLLARIARMLHDDLGPSLTGIGLQLSVFDGDPAERKLLQHALDHSIETVRTLQYLAYPGVAARFGLRRAFELLPYCAAPDYPGTVTVSFEDPSFQSGDPAQQCFEEAAAAVAHATLREPAPIHVRLDQSGWTLKQGDA